MGESINIMEYLEIFKKRKKVIFIILLIFILAGGLLQFKHSRSYVPTYSSTVSVRINTAKNTQIQSTTEDDKNTENNDSENSDEENNNSESAQSQDSTSSNSTTTPQESQYYYATSSLQNSTLNQSISEKYSSLAVSKRAMNELIDTLKLQGTTSSVASSISIVPQENLAEFIDITVTNTNRELAQKIANTMPTVFSNELQRVIGLDCVEVLYDATEPYMVPKAQDNTLRNFSIIGIVLAIFVVLLLECLDNKVVTPDDAEKYWGLPVIGVVPYEGNNSKGKRQKRMKKGA